MKLSIGIDVSKDKLDISIYDGKKHKHYICKNSISGIEKFIKEMKLNKNSNIIFIMEATGVYSLKVAQYLYKKKYPVSVVNPLIIKKYSELQMLRSKTDKIDSKMIAEYGYKYKHALYVPKPDDLEHIIQCLRAIDAIQRDKTQCNNRLKALQHNPQANEKLLEVYGKQLETFNKNIKVLEIEIENKINQSYSDLNDLIQSVPSIGKRVSSAMIGTFNQFEFFENAKQVSSYLGLNPSEHSSGSSIQKQAIISRQGNGYIRKLFFMASLTAIRKNKQCKELYERLLARGKSKKLALIAVANKLIRQIYAIVKSKRRYEENYSF